jgi:hypothetical protein
VGRLSFSPVSNSQNAVKLAKHFVTLCHSLAMLTAFLIACPFGIAGLFCFARLIDPRTGRLACSVSMKGRSQRFPARPEPDTTHTTHHDFNAVDNATISDDERAQWEAPVTAAEAMACEQPPKMQCVGTFGSDPGRNAPRVTTA